MTSIRTRAASVAIVVAALLGCASDDEAVNRSFTSTADHDAPADGVEPNGDDTAPEARDASSGDGVLDDDNEDAGTDRPPIENVVQIEWVMGDGTHDGGTVDGEYAATTTGVCDWRDADEEYLDGYVQAYWAIGTTQMGVTRARSSEDDPWSMVGLGGLEWDADEAGPAPEIYVDDAVSVAVVMDGVRMTTWGGGPSREAVVTGSMECDLQ